MTERSFSLALPEVPEGSTAIEIVFNLPRGEIRLVPEEGFFALDADPKEVLRASGLGRFLLDLTKVRAREIPLAIRFVGEPPELVKLIVTTPTGPLVLAPTGCTDDPHGYQPIGAPVGSLTDNLCAYVQELEDAIELGPDTPRKRHRLYFAELNLNSHGALTGLEIWKCGRKYSRPFACTSSDLDQAILRTKSILELRLLQRGAVYLAQRKLHHFAPLPETDPTGTKLVRPWLRVLSRMQIAILRRHFQGARRPVEEAFEMFANGELRLQLSDGSWTCQPSAGSYLFFAEFALFAMDEPVDEGFWSRLCPALLRTQEIFARAYAAKDPFSAGLADYNPCDYDAERAFACSEKRELAEAYAYLTQEELAWRAAHNAIAIVPGAVRSCPLP